MSNEESVRVSRILAEVVSRGLINDVTPSVETFDFDYLSKRISDLKKAFPEQFVLHAIAVKANPIRGILQEALKQGLGAECASIGEVLHSISIGFPPSKIVYDSPCRSRHDLEKALQAKVIIMLDNEHELGIVDELIQGSGFVPASIGLRINPVIGGGQFDSVSTATKHSKFGIPVTDDTRLEILKLYKKYIWLDGIFFHVGSQFIPLDSFVRATKFCLELVEEVEDFCERDLKTIDIGGGISSSYSSPTEPVDGTFEIYRSKMESEVPKLFSGKYRLVTEFGRALLLKAGQSFSRIEFIKNWLIDSEEISPAIFTHVGSNQFVQEVHHPKQWRHRFSVASKDGIFKANADCQKYDIRGPLCYKADYLAKDVELPQVEHGDILIIHDTGAYTMSMYSNFNSILPSPVYGFRMKEEGKFEIVCLKERETSEQFLKFWGSEEPRIL